MRAATITTVFGVAILLVGAGWAFAQLPPTDLPVTTSLQMHLDANYVTASGDRVSDWYSRTIDGSTGKRVYQNTVANRPLVVGNVWNGQNVIRFNSVDDDGDGINDFTNEGLTSSDYTPGITVPTSGPTDNYGEITVFAVAMQSGLNNAAGSHIRNITSASTPENGRGLFTLEQSRPATQEAQVATHGAQYKRFGNTLNNGVPHILAATFDYTYIDGGAPYQAEVQAFYDGTLGLNATYTTTNTAGTRPRNGTLQVGNDSVNLERGFSGDIAEVIVFERVLSGAERTLVENYLSSKYGAALATGDYYHGETGLGGDTGLKFDAGVFGIGRTTDGSSEVLTSTAATGVSFEAASLADGMWLLAGHNDAAHGWNTDSFYARWNREWAAEFTYNPGDTATFDLVFDFDAAGLAFDPDPEEPYGLMFKESYADPWQFALKNYTIDGNSLVFSGIPMGDTGGFGATSGYFTLGMVPEPSTLLLLCLALVGLSGRRRR